MPHCSYSAGRSDRSRTPIARVPWAWGRLVPIMMLVLFAPRASPAGTLPAPPAPLAVAVLPFTGQAPTAEYGVVLRQALQDGLAQLRGMTVVPARQLLVAADRLGIRLEAEPTDAQLLALGQALRVRVVLGGSYDTTDDGVGVRPWVADLAGGGAVVRGAALTTPADTYWAVPPRILAEALRRLDRRLTAWEAQRVQRLFGDPPTTPAQYTRYAQALWAAELATPNGHARALTLLNQAVAADPNFALGYLALAGILGLGSRWTATREVREALAIRPELTGAQRLLGDLLLAAPAPERPYDLAIQAYQAALATAPDDLEARLGLADARRGQGDVEGAIRVYRTAVATEPRNARVRYRLGILYADEKGWYAKAVAELRQATALDAALLVAWLSLGDLSQDKGWHAQAIACYQHVLAVAPHHLGATYNLALAYEPVNVARAIATWTQYLAWAEQASSDQEWVGIARKHLEKLVRTATPPAR